MDSSSPTPPVRYYRKIIRICGVDSPNVRLALAQQAAGEVPTNEMLVPGVLSWAEYVKRRNTWSPVRQKIGLDAQFHDGAEELLFPVQWLDQSNRFAEYLLANNIPRHAKSIGIDPAQGGDKTSMAAIDEYGLIELVSKLTPNTAVITSDAIKFGLKHRVPPDKWYFDRGGGGKVHADRLREMGYSCQTVAFGGSVSDKQLNQSRRVSRLRNAIRLDRDEAAYAYYNLRSEMYGRLSQLLDPAGTTAYLAYETVEQPLALTKGYKGFAIHSSINSQAPEANLELRRQLEVIPRRYDREERLKLPPKNKNTANSNEQTLVDLIGHSPDEADALVLAVYGLVHAVKRKVVGAMF